MSFQPPVHEVSAAGTDDEGSPDRTPGQRRRPAGTCVSGDDIGERNQAKRTGTWRRMNMLRFSESKTLNSVMISQM